MPPKRVTLNVSKWSRVAEVAAYAERRGISVGDAIRELVNAGLSHQ